MIDKKICVIVGSCLAGWIDVRVVVSAGADRLVHGETNLRIDSKRLKPVPFLYFPFFFFFLFFFCANNRWIKKNWYGRAEGGVDLGRKSAVAKFGQGGRLRRALGNTDRVREVEGVHKVEVLLVREIEA
jgi:hypothetical protein